MRDDRAGTWARGVIRPGLLWCLYAAAAAGCAVGPDFHPPRPAVPARWSGPATAPATQASTLSARQQAELAHWWTGFKDPVLTSLVEQAILGNLDLKVAQANIRQAQANVGVAVAQLFPTANATGLYNRSLSAVPGTPVPAVNSFQTGLNALWVIDVFGGARRNVEAAQADLQQARENHSDVLVTLVAQVGQYYIQLRGYQQQIVIAEENIKLQRHSAELTRRKFKGGMIDGLAVAYADGQLASTASTIPQLKVMEQQTIYQLSVLTGRPPGDLLTQLSPSGPIPPGVPEVPLLLPSDLLRRRPDIRAAEAAIHSATARIGVATAALFPSFNFSTGGGYQNGQLGQLIRSSSRFWSFGPSMNWTLFDAWETWSNIEAQRALEEQAMLTYQKTVLSALQDVENALAAYSQEQVHYKLLQEAMAANQKAAELATTLYSQGREDYLNVVSAQATLLGTQSSLVQSAQDLSLDLVALYEALGGGWDADAPQEASGEPRATMPARPAR